MCQFCAQNEKGIKAIDEILSIAKGRTPILDLKKKESEDEAWDGKEGDGTYFSYKEQNKRVKKFEKELKTFFKEALEEVKKRIRQQTGVFNFYFPEFTKQEGLSPEQWAGIIDGVMKVERFKEILDRYTQREVYLSFDETFQNTIKVHELLFDYNSEMPVITPTGSKYITKAAESLSQYELKLSESTAQKVDYRLKDIVFNGLENGDSVPKITKTMTTLFEDLKKWKARQIARTEIVRASARGSVASYAELGFSRFELQASFGACSRCLGLSGQTFSTYEQSAGTLPIHPSCRCAVLPDLKSLQARNTIF